MVALRIFGLPVRIRPLFWAVAAYISFFWASDEAAGDVVVVTLASVPIVTLAVLIHELGHALAARGFGAHPSIELYGLGGVTRWSGADAYLSAGKRLWVAFAGPLAGIVFGGLLCIPYFLVANLTPGATLAAHLLLFGVWVSLGWGLLNLIPVFPLDGGQMVSAFLELVFGPRGRLLALGLSLLVTVALAVLAASTGQWILMILAGFFAFQAIRSMRTEQVVGQDLALLPRLQEAKQALQRGAHQQAYRLADEVAGLATRPIVLTDATSVAAVAAASLGDGDGARAALARLPQGTSVSPVLEGLLRFADQEYSRAQGPLLDAYRSGERFVEEHLAESLASTASWDLAVETFAGRLKAQPRTLLALERAAFEDSDFSNAARLGEALHETTGSPASAYNVACAHARAGASDEARRWLGRAAETGFRDWEALDKDTDLAALRSAPGWDTLRGSLAMGEAVGSSQAPPYP